MQFQARVMDAAHGVQSVRVEATDLEDARQKLTEQRFQMLSIAPVKGVASATSLRSETFHTVMFAQELLALIDAGLSVIEAVEALMEKEPSARSRAVLKRIHTDLCAGFRLSAALRQQADTFPALFVGMVQAAEGTSNLHEALSRYVDYRGRVDAVRAKIISAAIYPVILLVVGSAVALFLLGYVVPRFASVYQSSGRSIPWGSQLLLAWGQFVATHWQWVLGAALLLLAVVAMLLRRSGTSVFWQHWVQQWPWVGERMRLMELSRLYLTLGLLLEGGLSITQALALSASVTSRQTQARVDQIRHMIAEGQSLSTALEAHELTTPVAIRLLRVGEASGQLGSMLRRAALFYEGETTRWIERFTKAFEPLLMAAIGVVVGLIVLLLYMPIFDLAGSLQ
jgi:general secretion pathway protein F